MSLLNIATSVLVLAGSFLAVHAARTPVRDSVDQFIEDLHKQGRGATVASIVAAIAAAATLVIELVKLF